MLNIKENYRIGQSCKSVFYYSYYIKEHFSFFCNEGILVVILVVLEAATSDEVADVGVLLFIFGMEKEVDFDEFAEKPRERGDCGDGGTRPNFPSLFSFSYCRTDIWRFLIVFGVRLFVNVPALPPLADPLPAATIADNLLLLLL